MEYKNLMPKGKKGMSAALLEVGGVVVLVVVLAVLLTAFNNSGIYSTNGSYAYNITTNGLAGFQTGSTLFSVLIIMIIIGAVLFVLRGGGLFGAGGRSGGGL